MSLYVTWLGFLLRRAFARLAEILFAAELADALLFAGLMEVVWNNLAVFLLTACGSSFLIDLFIEVTRPDLIPPQSRCDSDES